MPICSNFKPTRNTDTLACLNCLLEIDGFIIILKGINLIIQLEIFLYICRPCSEYETAVNSVADVTS